MHTLSSMLDLDCRALGVLQPPITTGSMRCCVVRVDMNKDISGV